MRMLEIDSDSTSVSIYEELFNNQGNNDFVFFYESDDSYIWFITKFTQFLVGKVDIEVVPIFGRLVKDLASFLYQVNFCLPVGYRMQANSHALYDILLNFETEPKRRVLIWNDADYMFASNKNGFEEIFDCMVVAAFSNRLGISTVKENGLPYIVDQRNFFFFKNEYQEDVQILLEKLWHIPSLDTKSKLDFNLVKII